MVRDSHTRSIVKTMSWRVIATTTTMVAAFIFTGELVVALSIGAVESVAKLLFYYLHERAWTNVTWGRHKVDEAHAQAAH